jgi:hypothetical protein
MSSKPISDIADARSMEGVRADTGFYVGQLYRPPFLHCKSLSAAISARGLIWRRPFQQYYLYKK